MPQSFIDTNILLYRLFDDRRIEAIERERKRNSLSFWDSLIVASALAGGAETLYSEDMQDGLIVYDRLAIINPFK